MASLSLTDIEFFSDLPSEGWSRQFASYGGDLVLVTHIPLVDSHDPTNTPQTINTIISASYAVGEEALFEHRAAVVSEKKGHIMTMCLFPEGGLLSDMLYSDMCLGWCFRLRIALDIARAICALHTSDYIHNDIRPATLGLDCEFRCKFLEIPFVEHVEDIFSPCTISPAVVGDVCYRAPEVLRDNMCTGASDMYSFGLVLFELCARVSSSLVPRDCETQCVDVDQLLENLPQSTPVSLQELIRQLLCAEPEYRPTVEDTIDWLDSLMMETSPDEDPADPPLPPLPFSERRRSSRRTGTGKATTGLGITLGNVERLREIAKSSREPEEDSVEERESRLFRPSDDASSPEYRDERYSKAEERKLHQRQTPASALGVEAIIGSLMVDDSELQGHIQLKAHNLPIHKSKYFFTRDGFLHWCSDKKFEDRPDRVHSFDLTCARLEEGSTPLQMHLSLISEETASSNSTRKGGHRKHFFSSHGGSKERGRLFLKFSSTESAQEWREKVETDMSRGRCQMCGCKVELTPEQIFQRDKYRYHTSQGDVPQSSLELAIFCSEQCYAFKSAVHFKGMNVSTVDGNVRLKVNQPEITAIDKRLVSKRNPSAWRRMSRKHGVGTQQPTVDNREAHLEELPSNIDEWLSSIDQSELASIFKSSDYGEISHILIAGLTEEDVAYMGISSKETVNLLIKSASELHAKCLKNRQVLSM